ncbi:prolyl-tRNA synthetase, putative [Perkinsus marinus ATCC 50983]|uniref:Prolyl-tRNA synthetase, putative n=1 Tax=Perkinsus marinus (strain ATCC 50983 / TXsc) TaxID=423536 RepID=C5L9M4_PERM5|nr:prolyl-tRNA synthetase, putative [Perkinsus marinus ATCC 50983]EER06569.1 prolyl-tRNA synthetase, putative [Perkinsus marinus ATCC 50983]|eukprot:XP_002774753.1 prolyl-tRNA synthetase, putative [Perkinsus marinus ATCC 50983]
MPRKSKKHTTVEEEETSTTTAMVPTEAATGSRKKARERAADVKLEPDSLEQRRRDLQRTIQKTVRKMRDEGVDETLIKVEINRIKNREQRVLMHAVKQQQRVEKGSKHEVVVIPIAWKQKAREKAEVDSASIAAKRALLSTGVDAWLDHRREYTPGQKFAYWEHLGVKYRVEIGPNDVAQNQCVVVRADEPGEWLKHQRKRGVRLSCRGIMSALVELGYDGGGAAGDMDRLDDDILEGTAGQEEHDGAASAAAVAEEVDEDVAGNVALSSDAPKKEKRRLPISPS